MNDAELLPNKKPIKETRIPQLRPQVHKLYLLDMHSQYHIPFLKQVLRHSTVYLLENFTLKILQEVSLENLSATESSGSISNQK